MHLWAPVQKVLSELLSSTPLYTAGFDFAPLLSLGLSATGTSELLLKCHPICCKHTLFTSWSLSPCDIWFDWEEHKCSSSLLYVLCCPFLKCLTCLGSLFVSCCMFILYSLNGKTNEIKRFPLEGGCHYGRIIKRDAKQTKKRNMQESVRLVIWYQKKLRNRANIIIKMCLSDRETGRQAGQAANSGGNGTRLSAVAPAVPNPNG